MGRSRMTISRAIEGPAALRALLITGCHRAPLTRVRPLGEATCTVLPAPRGPFPLKADAAAWEAARPAASSGFHASPGDERGKKARGAGDPKAAPSQTPLITWLSPLMVPLVLPGLASPLPKPRRSPFIHLSPKPPAPCPPPPTPHPDSAGGG